MSWKKRYCIKFGTKLESRKNIIHTMANKVLTLILTVTCSQVSMGPCDLQKC